MNCGYCEVKKAFEFKSKDKTNEMIFYKRSGVGSLLVKDTQDYVEANPFDMSDFEFWF